MWALPILSISIAVHQTVLVSEIVPCNRCKTFPEKLVDFKKKNAMKPERLKETFYIHRKKYVPFLFCRLLNHIGLWFVLQLTVVIKKKIITTCFDFKVKTWTAGRSVRHVHSVSAQTWFSNLSRRKMSPSNCKFIFLFNLFSKILHLMSEHNCVRFSRSSKKFYFLCFCVRCSMDMDLIDRRAADSVCRSFLLQHKL